MRFLCSYKVRGTMKYAASYDTITERYLLHAEKESSWNNLYERPFMCSIIGELAGKAVLDIGAATGFYSLFAQERGAHVTAVDSSSKMLEFIHDADTRGTIHTVQADVGRGLPFLEDNSQDCIICSLVLHYIEDWTEFLADCYRVLKMNGRLFISTHHPVRDSLGHQEKHYSSVEPVTELWGEGKNAFDVTFYSRPLAKILQPLLDSPLTLVSINEPLSEKFGEVLDPQRCNSICNIPAFLFLILEK